MEFGFNLTKIIHSCTIWKWILQAFNRWHCINNTLYITLTYVKIDFVLSREIRYAQKPYQLSIKRTVVRRMQTRRAERWTTHTYCSCYRSALVWGGMVNTRTLTVHAGTATCWPLAGRPLLPIHWPVQIGIRDQIMDRNQITLQWIMKTIWLWDWFWLMALAVRLSIYLYLVFFLINIFNNLIILGFSLDVAPDKEIRKSLISTWLGNHCSWYSPLVK